MNTKMKKVVAGAVLGTFAFGVASPAFAVPTSEQRVEMTVASTQYIKDMPLDHGSGDIETYGIKGMTLKALKELVENNWTKITTLMIEWNIEIEMIKNLNELKSTFFDAMDSLFGVCDTVHELLVESFKSIGFNSTMATLAADAVCFIIL
ncbi:MAG: hypothetical protein ACLUKQ_00090 [Peptococcaceae bacterium]